MPIKPLPGESPEYGQLRAELMQAEIGLRDQVERVAELRRKLPLDTEIEDPVFEEIRDGVRTPVRLSELCRDGKTAVLVHFMYGKGQEHPCPMCTLWADGYDGVVPHLEQRMSFAVLVAGDVGAFSDYARSRGWRHLRLLSAGDSDLKRQLGFEDEQGGQQPGVSVFRLGDDGKLLHFTSVCAFFGEPGFRGMDQLSPFWQFLDLTPEGRGDFFPQKRYEA